MRIKVILRDILSKELVLLWLLKGTLSSFLPSSNNGIYRLNYQSSFLTTHMFQLALVSLSLPWTISGDSITAAATKPKVRILGNSTSTTPKPKRGANRRRKAKNLPQKQTSANNALLANIDFLTQLTNNKQEKNTEMDPLKCFPKALCGLSAESAAITRRRKNGLISDYIRLMKAVALNPSVMDKTLKRLKADEDEKLQDDTAKDSSEEDGEDDDEEDDDGDGEERRQPALNKRTNNYSYGYGSGAASHSKQEQRVENDGPAKKRTKRKEMIPKDSAEFTKQFLQEKAHVERLLEDGFFNEETESQNWWAYEKETEPELEELVGFDRTTLDSASAESYYTFGGKRKPNPPSRPDRPDSPLEPEAPEEPPMPMSPPKPPRPQPPPTPVVRVPDSNYGASGPVSTIGNFLRNLFGFGSSNNGQFTGDPFFQGFQRSLPDGTPTVVTVDKTKEILTTAIEIGETLRSPNQCNSLFNGCRYQYVELLHVIDDIRQSLAKRGKNDFHSSEFYNGADEENESGAKADDTHSSYGYKSSLAETSQAETLSPDYTGAISAVTRKNRRRKKKKSSFRDGKMNSMSRETSVEIGSDEPTMYGSGQQNFDFHHQYNRHGLSHDPHHHHSQPSRYNNQQQQGGGYQPSYQFEEMHIRQPKTIWGTILSWFGFQ